MNIKDNLFVIVKFLDVVEAINLSLVNKYSNKYIVRKNILNNNKITISKVINIIETCVKKGINLRPLCDCLSPFYYEQNFIFKENREYIHLNDICTFYINIAINKYCRCNSDSKRMCLIPKDYKTLCEFEMLFSRSFLPYKLLTCDNNTNQTLIRDIIKYNIVSLNNDFTGTVQIILSKMLDFSILDALWERYSKSIFDMEEFLSIIIDNSVYYELLEYILDKERDTPQLNKLCIIIPILERNKKGKLMYTKYKNNLQSKNKKSKNK